MKKYYLKCFKDEKEKKTHFERIKIKNKNYMGKHKIKC